MAEIQAEDCTIVIPAYNEEKRIKSLLGECAIFQGTLIVVCDGSDSTADVVRAFALSHPDLDLSCLEFQERLGKGGGVLRGLDAAKTPYLGFMDADGSTSLTEMRRLFTCLKRADSAIGSRWISGSHIIIKQSIWRRLQSRAFNLMVRILFDLPYSDTQCGAKVFRREALDVVLPDMQTTGFEFDVELLWRLKTAGLRVFEVPVIWEDRDTSKVVGTDSAEMLNSLLRLRISGNK